MSNLYIGLGGAGISSVAEFAMKVRDHGADNNNEYLYLDTDESSKELYPFIAPDFVHLGGATRRGHSIANMILNAARMVGDPNNTDVVKKKFVRFLQWYDTNIAVYAEGLAMPVGCARMLYRALLFADYENIKRMIANKMFYKEADGQCVVRTIYVVAGSCGGTSSGILLDILYMFNEIMICKNAAYQVPVNLLLVMPQGYLYHISPQSSLYSEYRLNAYAFFNEINACLKDYYGFKGDNKRNAGMQWNKYRCCDNDVPPFQFKVYDNGFLFDSIDTSGQPLYNKEIAGNVADFLLMYEEAQQIHSIVDNSIRAEKFNSSNSAFIKGFAATGTFVVQTWEELTRKYVHDKFIYQMLAYGFVGSLNKLPQAQLMSDVNIFNERIMSLFQDFHIDSLIADILSDNIFRGSHGANELIRFMDHLKCAVACGVNQLSIEKDVIDYKNRVKLVNTIDSLLGQVRESTYTLCSEWAMKYSLCHTLQIVDSLNVFYDRKYKDKKNHIMCFERTRYLGFLTKTENLRKEMHMLLRDYIEYLVYRNLSNMDEGHLDHCRQLLLAAIGEVERKFHDYLKDDWEIHYIRYLRGLIDDPKRVVFPKLGSLVDDKLMLREGNNVERDYASLVYQADEGKGPNITFDPNNDNLLYTYKQKCIYRIIQRDERWAYRFSFLNEEQLNKGDAPKSFFSDNIIMAFRSFAKEVETVAAELAQDNRLNKPFSNLVLSQPEKEDLVNCFDSFNHVELNTCNEIGSASSLNVYLADFISLSWLQNALNPDASPNVQTIQSNNKPDRIIKLNVRFGCSFDDYLYYKAEYLNCYNSYLKEFNGKPRHHHSFIDKRFLGLLRPGESLADMFARLAQEGNNGV